jgi:hypothetical protein
VGGRKVNFLFDFVLKFKIKFAFPRRLGKLSLLLFLPL